MRRIVALVVVFLLPVGCSGGGDGEGDDTATVLAAWQEYKDAVLASDGETAAGRLSEGTIEYYAGLLEASLHADERELSTLSTLDVATVLITRHEFDAETLRGLDGRGYLEVALDHGLIDENTVRGISFDRVELEGHTARLRQSGRAQGLVGLDMRKEAGRWRVHLVGLIQELSSELDRQVDARGTSRSAAALELIRASRPDAGPDLLVPED